MKTNMIKMLVLMLSAICCLQSSHQTPLVCLTNVSNKVYVVPQDRPNQGTTQNLSFSIGLCLECSLQVWEKSDKVLSRIIHIINCVYNQDKCDYYASTKSKLR